MKYLTRITQTDDTGLCIYSVEDPTTGFVTRTAIPQNGDQVASLMAYAGAKFSRSSLGAEEIFRELHTYKVDAQQRLATIFNNYGHASVADMAQIFVWVENIPQTVAFRFFYETSVGAGQERSTRYQNFSSNQTKDLPEWTKSCFNSDAVSEIEEDYHRLQRRSLDLYVQWLDILTQKFKEHFNISAENNSEMSAVRSRSLDCARSFLLLGAYNTTSLAYMTSAREWARLIKFFDSQPTETIYNSLATQLRYMLTVPQEGYTPEAPDLIKYTFPDGRFSGLDYAQNLYERLSLHQGEVDKANRCSVQLYDPSPHFPLYQLLLTHNPHLSYKRFIKKINNISKKVLSEIQSEIYNLYDHHHQMENWARSGVFLYELDISVAEARDFNRHRAWGRFTPFFHMTSSHINRMGNTTPLYLHNKDFTLVCDLFKEDQVDFDNMVRKFVQKCNIHTKFFTADREEFLRQILPFSRKIRYFMHGSLKEISYMGNLRVRPGGHINYRETTWVMLDKLKDQHGIPITPNIPKPDPESREQFLDRS